MGAASRIQEKFIYDNFVLNVISWGESLSTSIPKENILLWFQSFTKSPFQRGVGRVVTLERSEGFEDRFRRETKTNMIETIGRRLTKQIVSIMCTAIFIVFTVISLIAVNSAFGAGVWRKRASMPQKRWSLSTVAVNDKIYTIGGFAVNELSAVEEYDPTTDTWTRKTNMPTPRGALSTAVVNGKIYAIGGWDVDALSTVEEYDPVTDTWTRKANMPTARHALSTTAVNGKIYAIGGADKNNRAIPTVEAYDAATDTWTKKASMPTPRGLHSASMVNGKIYVIGGWVGGLGGRATSTVEVYDPAQNTWTKGAKMPTSRWAHASSVVNDKIYVIGGTIITKGKWATVSRVEVYHPATGKWTQESRMSSPRGWLATSAVRGKIYAIGGASKYMIGMWDAVLVSTVEEFDIGFAVDASGKLPTLWGKLKVWQGGKIE